MKSLKAKSLEKTPFYLLVASVFASVFIYVLMEWVFFVTKSSFLSTLSIGEMVLVFLQTEWTIFLFIIPLILLLAGLSFLPFPWLNSAGKGFLLFVASAFLAITALLIIDNFTYNVLDYGIIRSRGIWRGAYMLLFALIVYFCYRCLFRFASNPKSQKTTGMIALAILVLSDPGGAPWIFHSDRFRPIGECESPHPYPKYHPGGHRCIGRQSSSFLRLWTGHYAVYLFDSG